jgi:cytochrome c peroxidase
MAKRLAKALAAVGFITLLQACGDGGLSQDEKSIVASLALAALPPLPPDASNSVADDPAAQALGNALFFDTRLSANGAVACATCHLPDRQFQDDRPLAIAIGTNTRRTMPLAGVSWGPWFFWDGRKDSLWSQALGPLENPVEHGSDRTTLVNIVAANYRVEYENLFGPVPALPTLRASPLGASGVQSAWEALPAGDREAVNRVFSNTGKAIAAFERTIAPKETRFDRFAAAVAAGKPLPGDENFTPEELTGLKLFIGKAACVTCHTGPRFTDDHFHNTGVPAAPGLPPDGGRAAILKEIDADPFNCLGDFSDASKDACAEMRFMSRNETELARAFKTPSLRGAASRGPYMHAGQIKTLADVVRHYNRAPASPMGHSEIVGLNLSDAEQKALVAFLKTLD